MNSKTICIGWLCGALALNVAHLQAQETKPADQPLSASAQPPTATPKEDLPPATPTPASARQAPSRSDAAGPRGGNRGPGNPPNAGTRNADQSTGRGREGIRRPPMEGQRSGGHGRGEARPQSQPGPGPVTPPQQDFHRPKGRSGSEYGRPTPPDQGARSPRTFGQRSGGGLRLPPGGPQAGQMHRGPGGPGWMGQGFGSRFGSHWRFGRQRTPGIQQFGPPRASGGRSRGGRGYSAPLQPSPRNGFQGGHGPGTAPHDGGNRMAPPFQRGPSVPHGPPPPQRGRRGPATDRSV